MGTSECAINFFLCYPQCQQHALSIAQINVTLLSGKSWKAYVFSWSLLFFGSCLFAADQSGQQIRYELLLGSYGEWIGSLTSFKMPKLDKPK